MLALSGEWISLAAKVIGGTLVFIGVLWSIRAANPRAIGMMLTFPALNGIVLLTATDKIVSEMIVGIFPLMFFNGFLAAIFIALCRRLGVGDALAYAVCLLAWALIAILLEWRELWPYRWNLAIAVTILILCIAAWAFRALRSRWEPAPALADHPIRFSEFMRSCAPRVGLFFASLLLVSIVAYVGRDAHSLVGRLSALPLIPLFVLHLAVKQSDADLGELRIAALLGPPVAGGFLLLFGGTLLFVRMIADPIGLTYWLVGVVMLIAEWALAWQVVLGVSRLTYRA
jgi:hypothetical protein